jgi:hypothetical protein
VAWASIFSYCASYFGSLELVPRYCNNLYLNFVLFEVRNVFTSLLGLVIVSHLSSKGSGRFTNPTRADDTSTLAKDLLGVSLVPEITVQSVPDATSSPPVDQEVSSVFHPMPFRFSFDPPSEPALVDAFIKAYPNLLGYHMWSTWDRLTAVSTYGPPGSEEDDEPDSGWDFFGLSNPSAMRDFMAACDYCLSDYSDGGHSLDDEDCGPSRECFHVDLGGLDEGNHLGMPEDGDPPRPVPRVDILRELDVVPVPAGGSGHTARANLQDAGQARQGSRATCAAPAEHRAGVGRPSTSRRSASSGPGCPAPHR